jgi:hypothetical protein
MADHCCLAGWVFGVLASIASTSDTSSTGPVVGESGWLVWLCTVSTRLSSIDTASSTTAWSRVSVPCSSQRASSSSA